MAVTPGNVGPAPPPDAARPGKKVARFINAEAAQSTLNIADDGRLPELQLQESTQAKTGEAGGSTVHPLVLLGLVSLSVVASVLLVLYEPRQETLPRSTAKRDARHVIVSEYFADEELTDEEIGAVLSVVMVVSAGRVQAQFKDACAL